MENLTLAVRCTREEYLNFYAECRKTPVWLTLVGAVVLAVSVALAMLDRGVQQHTLLLGLIGAALVLMKPLIVPFMRKGEAGRRYDNSDSLKGAVTVTLNEHELTVRTACREGTVPLAAMTAVLRTKDMTALMFGKELTVHIPTRTMNDDEKAMFDRILKKESV